MQNHQARRILALILIALLIAAVVVVLRQEGATIASIRNVSLLPLIVLFVLQSLFCLGNGLILRNLSRKFGIVLTTKEWLGLPFVTSMGNYLTPFSGGMIARATYLNRCHGLSIVRFGTMLAVNVLLYFWLAGVMGLTVLVALARESAGFIPLFLFFVSIVMATSALIFLPWPNLSAVGRPGVFLQRAFEGWSILKADKPLLVRISLYMTGNFLLGAAMFWVAFRALGTEAAFANVFVTSLLSGFTFVLNLTPGNLGVQEAAFSVTAGLLNLGFETGLLAALIVRSVTMTHTFTLGPLAGYLLAGGFQTHRPASASSDDLEKNGGRHS